MTTQHQVIVEAVGATLKQEPAIAGGRVFVGRTRSISSDKQAAVVVRLERSASQQSSVMGGRTGWQTLISVECYGRDAGADAVVEQVFARLAGNPNLGGLAMDVEPLAGDTLSWDFDELDTSLACITARFVVKHQTTGRTLTL